MIVYIRSELHVFVLIQRLSALRLKPPQKCEVNKMICLQKKYGKHHENISQDQILLKYFFFFALSKSIQPTWFKIKLLNPVNDQHTNWSACHSKMLERVSCFTFIWTRFWCVSKEIGQFLCYRHPDSQVWKSQNKTECCFHPDGHKKGSNDWRGECQSFVQPKWSVSSGSQHANKNVGSFHNETERQRWNSDCREALNVSWHCRISSDTSFLWPDNQEPRNKPLNFNLLRPERIRPSIHPSIQTKQR